MPYTFNVIAVDLSSSTKGPLFGDAVTAKIFKPPAAAAGAAAVDSVTGVTFKSPFQLAFMSAAVPPADAFDLLVSDSTTSGDLFRSGPLQPLPPSPGPLILWVSAAQTISSADINSQIQALFPLTIPVPGEVQTLVGLLMWGSMIPQSITVSDFSLTLGSPVALEIYGTINVTYLGFIQQSSGFSLSVNLRIGPSGDAKDTSRIVAVGSIGVSIDLILDSLFLLPPAAIAISQFAADAISSQIESQLNNLILQSTTAALLRETPPMQMTPTATISLGRLLILGDGLNAVFVLGDLFGPGVQPVPVPKFPQIEVAPQWNCGVVALSGRRIGEGVFNGLSLN